MQGNCFVAEVLLVCHPRAPQSGQLNTDSIESMAFALHVILWCWCTTSKYWLKDCEQDREFISVAWVALVLSVMAETAVATTTHMLHALCPSHEPINLVCWPSSAHVAGTGAAVSIVSATAQRDPSQLPRRLQCKRLKWHPRRHMPHY